MLFVERCMIIAIAVKTVARAAPATPLRVRVGASNRRRCSSTASANLVCPSVTVGKHGRQLYVRHPVFCWFLFHAHYDDRVVLLRRSQRALLSGASAGHQVRVKII